jgi:hypothetical protein
MAQSQVLSDLETIAQAGEEIYRDRYRARYEAAHFGKFLAIDVVTGEAILADEPEDALEQAHKASPNRMCYLIRIGFPGAFGGGFSSMFE